MINEKECKKIMKMLARYINARIGKDTLNIELNKDATGKGCYMDFFYYDAKPWLCVRSVRLPTFEYQNVWFGKFRTGFTVTTEQPIQPKQSILDYIRQNFIHLPIKYLKD